MKKISSFCSIILLLILVGFGCRNNPLSGFVSQYNCTIPGEPEPKTSEDYYERAQKHIEIYSGDGATSLDDCAFGALSEAIRLNPNNAQALRARGYGYRRKKQYDLALADYDKAIQIEPDSPDGYALRSFVYEETGSFDKAIKDISQAIKYEPEYKEHYSRRAEFYRKLGQNDLAEADMKKYKELLAKKR